MKNSFKETLVRGGHFFWLLGQEVFTSLFQNQGQLNMKKRLKSCKKNTFLTLRAFAIQDSIIKIGEEKRNLNIKNRDSLEGVIHYGVNKIDSLTVISIDSNDLNEAMRWLDSISH